MRVIKFRAWDTDKKEMIYQSPVSSKLLMMTWDGGLVYENGVLQTQLVLMQFTGILDKNGKEIYEGDILCHEHTTFPFREEVIIKEIGEVSFSTQLVVDNEGYRDNFVCGFLIDGEHPDWLGEEEKDKTEIIGNIYENPDLLKGHV